MSKDPFILIFCRYLFNLITDKNSAGTVISLINYYHNISFAPLMNMSTEYALLIIVITVIKL